MANTEPYDELTRFLYLDWQDLYEREKPFQIFSYIKEPGVRPSNLVFKQGEPELVHDARGRESRFRLDREGFQFIKHETGVKSFDDARVIENAYLLETEELVKKHIGDAEIVYTFDWRIRKSGGLPNGTPIIDAMDKMNHLLPAKHVHVDASASDVLGIIRRQLPEELLTRRVRAVNAWRPIVDTVYDYPLALCDGSTVSDSDLVEMDHIRLQSRSNTKLAKPSFNYKWYYLSRQHRDEVTLFKNFDSDEDVAASCCPHSSFQATRKTEQESRIPRESIEVRLLVFSRLQDKIER